jgi:signal transduction histidine kinase/ActR/RegA family two-component response regulator
LTDDLQRRSGELETLFNVLPIGLAIAADPECRHIRANRTLARHIGIAEWDNASLTPFDGAAPPFRLFAGDRELKGDELPMQHAAREGIEVNGMEVDMLCRDGRRLSFMEYAFPLYDNRGVVRGAIGVFVDITDRRRNEREQRFLADASQLLSSSLDYEMTLRSLARLAVPALGDVCAVDVVREDGTLERVEAVTGDETIRPLVEQLRGQPPFAASPDSAANLALREGRPALVATITDAVMKRIATNPEHLRLLRAIAPQSAMMLPLRARGRTLGLMTVVSLSPARRYTSADLALASDVASRAALALDNALLYRDAQEANRLKEDFLATLSHELRTPLNALLGWAHMLKSTPMDDAARARALESVERNAQTQAVLINDLLDVSRIISGKLKLAVRPVNVQAVVLAAVEAVRPAIDAREIDLALSLSPVGGELVGDPDRLQQVMWNLLSNAVKFTPPGGHVTIAVEDVGGAVQITVSDTGIGIDPMFLPHAFERFRQADSSTTRTHGGLGLGLAIVRNLVDLHGGTVSAKSEGLGKGSTFVVTLPLRRPAVESAPLGPAGPPAIDTGILRGIRVLAVDDDADSRELLLLIIQNAGAEVMSVGSAQAALEVLATFSPHVLVADIALPGMDGYGLMREVVRRKGRDLPAIALSAYMSPDDVRRSSEAGFAVHLGKPADYERLVRTIADLTGGAPALRTQSGQEGKKGSTRSRCGAGR